MSPLCTEISTLRCGPRFPVSRQHHLHLLKQKDIPPRAFSGQSLDSKYLLNMHPFATNSRSRMQPKRTLTLHNVNLTNTTQVRISPTHTPGCPAYNRLGSLKRFLLASSHHGKMVRAYWVFLAALQCPRLLLRLSLYQPTEHYDDAGERFNLMVLMRIVVVCCREY